MEYLLLIFEFYFVKKRKSLISIILLPVVLSFFVLFIALTKITIISIQNIEGEMITLIGILLGFTISLFAILISSNNSQIREAKNSYIEKKVLGKEISIYDMLLSGIAYAIIMECILLFICIVVPLLMQDLNAHKIYFSILIGSIAHVIIILLRSVLDFYFTTSKR